MAEDTKKTTKYVPMILEKSQAPKGAIRLNRTDIVKLQNARLDRCNSTYDKFAFQFAPHILGGASVLTAARVNSYFRTKFRVQQYGLLLGYVPVVVIPTLLCLTADQHLKGEVLLLPNCRECLQVKSGVAQSLLTVVYSSLIASATAVYMSQQHVTFMNHKSRFQPSFKYAFTMSMSTLGGAAALMAINFGLAAALRYKQQVQLDRLIEKESNIDTRELLELIRD